MPWWRPTTPGPRGWRPLTYNCNTVSTEGTVQSSPDAHHPGRHPAALPAPAGQRQDGGREGAAGEDPGAVPRPQDRHPQRGQTHPVSNRALYEGYRITHYMYFVADLTPDQQETTR